MPTAWSREGQFRHDLHASTGEIERIRTAHARLISRAFPRAAARSKEKIAKGIQLPTRRSTSAWMFEYPTCSDKPRHRRHISEAESLCRNRRSALQREEWTFAAKRWPPLSVFYTRDSTSWSRSLVAPVREGALQPATEPSHARGRRLCKPKPPARAAMQERFGIYNDGQRLRIDAHRKDQGYSSILKAVTGTLPPRPPRNARHTKLRPYQQGFAAALLERVCSPRPSHARRTPDRPRHPLWPYPDNATEVAGPTRISRPIGEARPRTKTGRSDRRARVGPACATSWPGAPIDQGTTFAATALSLSPLSLVGRRTR